MGPEMGTQTGRGSAADSMSLGLLHSELPRAALCSLDELRDGRVYHLLVFTSLSLGKGTWSVESCELMTQRGTDVTRSTKLTAAQVVLYRGGWARPSVGI